ncbi:MAG: aminopeptidase P family protein [Saprospiraceae bacterium]|nr:aminopeptidase P family protein [Saprospiraceae bacterium]
MFSADTYTNRRNQLKKDVEKGLILILGNNDVGMNYAGNTFRYRQDSNFLYFFGIDQAGLAAVIDLEDGSETIFGDELTIDDVIWVGTHTSISEMAEKVGVKQVKPAADLEKVVKAAKQSGKPVHYLPPYRDDNKIKLHQWLGIAFEDLKSQASESFIKAVVKQRSHKSAEEIQQMEVAVNVSGSMHIAAMIGAAEGKTEAQLTGIVQGIAVGAGGDLAYPIILSKDGQTLHNHYHGNVLKEGQLVLGDFGAETPMRYAGDLTRTFPVSKTFTAKQKEIYQIVLDAEMQCIEGLKPGIPYREFHLKAARIITEGLKGLGLMKGDTDEAVAAGAHALFFPHGLGHMIGLDVHDMEDLGENYVGYSDSIKRSEQFGTAFLRLGRELEAGFVLTVEPGIYFIPELIDLWKSENKFENFINYSALDSYRDFGGVRIEDNVLITENGHKVLGNPVPKSIEDVEKVRSYQG